MTILDKIFQYKHEELVHLKAAQPLAEVRAAAEDSSPTRGFGRALAASPHPVSLIAEVKKASPVKGVIREDFDPVAIATDYAAAGADCLSVLTDEKFFQGSPEFLKSCRAAVSLPVIRKDFTADVYHVFQARAMGADAILLIAAKLGLAEMADMQGEARALGMDVLVEVHTPVEAEMALEMGADLIGVNNRDLTTFEVNLSHSEEILPMIRDHAIAVSESALHSAADVARVGGLGARSVLIGTAFCRSPEIQPKVKELMGW
jgi:indole-3-glycerol phosphate synthase